MQTALPVLAVAVLVGAAIALLVRDRRRQQRLRLRIKKLYASQLFEDMLPLLQACRKRPLEQLIVDKTGVVMRYLHFAGGESAFLMRPNGYRYLSPDQQEALRAVLEECLPKIRDSQLYHLSRQRIRLLNGQVEYAYRYTISNAYKGAPGPRCRRITTARSSPAHGNRAARLNGGFQTALHIPAQHVKRMPAPVFFCGTSPVGGSDSIQAI